LPPRDCRTIGDQTTYMSINSVSRAALPYYGPLTATNNSPTAGSAALAGETPETTALRQTVTPAATSNGEPGERVDSALEKALRQFRVATGTSTSGESHSGSGRYTPAIGLYRRVSQYSDDRSSVSGLMKSWNDIVRENQFEEPGVADYVKAVAQNDAVALPSGVLRVTA
jgi:hypothetical protein